MEHQAVYSIREWAPLTDVLDRIPIRVQCGLFSVNLSLTCIDAVDKFLALGTNVGQIFWYDRYTTKVQKFKTESNKRITCIKIVDSIDYMVAAGNTDGQMYVFRIQKCLVENLSSTVSRALPAVALIERYTICDLHSTDISCCEWSKNGINLYSGDRGGSVALTEFDYLAHISKSIEILNEAYEIVQLSTYRGYLLVTNLCRSLVCHRTSNSTWNITQVDSSIRKQLVDCGGVFFKKFMLAKPNLICGGANMCFCLADADGNIQKTISFQEAITRSPTLEIPTLNPKYMHSHNLPSTPVFVGKEEQPAVATTKHFRNIFVYGDNDCSALIVTHDGSCLYILNVETLQVEAIAKGFRNIHDLTVCHEEIFILEGDRSIIRLAPKPEKPNQMTKVIFNPLLPPPIPLIPSANCAIVETPILYEPEGKSIYHAEECFELPPIQLTNSIIPIELAVESCRSSQINRVENFQEIAYTDFDEHICYHSSRKKLKRKHSNERSTGLSVPIHLIEIGEIATENTDTNSYADNMKAVISK